MKAKVSFEYILVVVGFICDAHQLIGHLLLALRREKDIYIYIYIWKSSTQR